MTTLSKRPTRRLSARYCRAVTFFWRDYAAKNARKTLTLDAVEFLHRFPVLPPRFTRVRYNGFLANRDRSVNVAKARALMPRNDRSAHARPFPTHGFALSVTRAPWVADRGSTLNAIAPGSTLHEHDDPFRPGRSSIVIAA